MRAEPGLDPDRITLDSARALGLPPVMGRVGGMVCATQRLDAPPTTAAIVGGFVSLPVGSLLAAWFASQGLDLGVGHFRAWLAALEMVKRRSFARPGAPTAYGFAELARLLGVTPARARLLVRDLEAAGLLTWSESAITFPEPPKLPDDLFGPFADTIGRGKGSLIIPRALLRFLAHGASPATIAVALAALFRCLSCRNRQPDGWGRLKTSWIARAFRVGERQVVAARNQLVDLGWLLVEGDNRQSAMNRWGRAYRINLCWNPPARPSARSAPPPPAPAARSAPPLLDRNPLREEFKNQNPASGGPAGVQLSEGEGETESPAIPNPPAARPMTPPSTPAPVVPPSTPAPVVPPSTPAPVVPPSTPAPVVTPSTDPAPTPPIAVAGSPAVPPPPRPSADPGPSSAVPGPVPAPGGPPAARLEDVRVEDLKDTARLMDLLGQAMARGLVSTSEADRLRFVGAAEHALAIGKENPAGLFLYLVRGKLWRYLTQEDEDRANARIKASLRGPEPPRVASSPIRPPSGPALSEDARAVREFRRALAAVKYRGDPFPQVRRQDPSWTRERWDRAMAELERAR